MRRLCHATSSPSLSPTSRTTASCATLSVPSSRPTSPPDFNPYSSNPSLKRSFAHVINYSWEGRYAGIHRETNFSAAYPGNLLVISMHQFAGEVLKLPSAQRKLHALGVTRSAAHRLDELSWYRLCAQNVFRPSAHVMEVARPYLKRMEGREVVGVHARMGNHNGKWHESTVFLRMGNVAKQVPKIHAALKKDPESRVFLSTDSDKVEALFKREFGDSLVIVDSLPRMHVGKSSANEAGVMRSFVDLYLLGQCNVLYLTPRSGFSHIGLAMNRKNPVVVYM